LHLLIRTYTNTCGLDSWLMHNRFNMKIVCLVSNATLVKTIFFC